MRQKHSHNFLHGQKYMIKAKKLSHQLWRNEEAQEQRGDREELGVYCQNHKSYGLSASLCCQLPARPHKPGYKTSDRSSFSFTLTNRSLKQRILPSLTLNLQTEA